MSLVQPGFVTYDEKGREAYLSQLGNFSPVERSLFHKLCRVWEPIIPYRRFIAMISRDTPNATAELLRLMTKLTKSRMGLITSSIKEGQREEEGILLCEPGEQLFYSSLLDEEILDVFQNLLAPMPSRGVLQQKGIHIPPEFIRQAEYRQIAQLYVNKKTQGVLIYSLPLGKDDALIFPQSAITRILTIQIAKYRAYFQSANFLALIATLMQMSLTELKNASEGKEPGFWQGLGKTILAQRPNLEAQRKVKLPDDLFQIAYFLDNFLMAQIEVAKEMKKKDEEREADMLALVEIVRGSSGQLFLPQGLFETHLESMQEKYGGEYQQFRKAFEDRFFQPDAHHNLPAILRLEGNYIHQDNLRDLFLMRIEKVSKELYRHYVPLMSRWIRSSSSQVNDVFNSVSTFEADIGDRIKEMDALLASLLSKPATVAEAFIHAGKKGAQIANVEDMKSLLVGFFYPDQIQFKELQIIFNLNVRDIYQHAFLNFGILRQLIMRITGRHESYLRKFSDQSQGIYRRMATEMALPESYSPRRKAAREDAASGLVQGGRQRISPGRQRGLSSGTSSSAGSGRYSGRGKAGSKSGEEPVKKRLYSRQEQDDAWSEFYKSLKK